MYTIRPPFGINKLFTNYLWQIDTDEKELYLTFDDGPQDPVTNQVLDILSHYKIKATFFCVGANVEKQAEIFQRILSEGHSVGNHTYHHLNGWRAYAREYKLDVEKAEKIIDSRLFRPPYGKMTPSQAKTIREKGYRIVMWDVLSADFDTEIDAEQCYENVVDNVENGSIIVFHDSVKAAPRMLEALPKCIETLSSKGYTFKSL